ncbi:NUDIX hydrolase [Nonomuraea sp. NPDC049269]|uniref:NUDIX hydrolase n=1 Tax=Nonomuraea sp. NPDC049269 TaxID=3364349 RepID=UPI0037244A76
MAETSSIAAAIIVDGGRVLLVRRAVPEGRLVWQFPAGKVEPGETPEQAAVRETCEEAGLDVAVVKSLGERIHPATGRRMVYIACNVVAGTAWVADAAEIAEVEWCGQARVAELVPFPFYGPVQDHLDDVLD